jgi:hypothetical protein
MMKLRQICHIDLVHLFASQFWLCAVLIEFVFASVAMRLNEDDRWLHASCAFWHPQIKFIQQIVYNRPRSVKHVTAEYLKQLYVALVQASFLDSIANI